MNRQRRDDALVIFQAALAAADSHAVISRNLTLEPNALVVAGQKLPLAATARIVIVGAGKASARMAESAAAILGKRLSGGCVSVKDGHSVDVPAIVVREAGHPLPDERSIRNGREIIACVQNLSTQDIVLCLLSGGGSALMEDLGPGLTLDHLRAVTRALMHAGADIVELNCVRKHISVLKGGQLARWAQPSRVCALILSDVVGDDISSIASGPTAPDPSTFRDAIHILEQYGVAEENAVKPVFNYLTAHLGRGESDTPKPDDRLFQNVTNVIVGSNRMALSAAARQAEALGYYPEILTSYMQGEAREVGKLLAGIVRERAEKGHENTCLLAGGETTVTVRGHGRGGRNQELALAAAMVLAGVDDLTVLSAATDGGDGSSAAAGALIDGTTLARARALGMRPTLYLANNDSDAFFSATSDQIITGPTLTNVNDLVIALCR
jgi:glycerate-2-kinase